MTNHSWTYQENEFCVEQAFKSFVIERDYDYEFVINKLYHHFEGAITKGSIRMKLQNIKYLFNKFNVPNTLTLTALYEVSSYNEQAFTAICKKYSKLYTR